jgi:hypothetical protein
MDKILAKCKNLLIQNRLINQGIQYVIILNKIDIIVNEKYKILCLPLPFGGINTIEYT